MLLRDAPNAIRKDTQEFLFRHDFRERGKDRSGVPLQKYFGTKILQGFHRRNRIYHETVSGKERESHEPKKNSFRKP